MTTTYRAEVSREGRWWMIAIPQVDGLTQTRRLGDAEQMARELLAVVLDVSPAEVQVDVVVKQVAGVDVEAELAAIRAERAEAARMESDAAHRVRTLARGLVASEVPLRDVGALLGVSHQRVHQLVND